MSVEPSFCSSEEVSFPFPLFQPISASAREEYSRLVLREPHPPGDLPPPHSPGSHLDGLQGGVPSRHRRARLRTEFLGEGFHGDAPRIEDVSAGRTLFLSLNSPPIFPHWAEIPEDLPNPLGADSVLFSDIFGRYFVTSCIFSSNLVIPSHAVHSRVPLFLGLLYQALLLFSLKSPECQPNYPKLSTQGFRLGISLGTDKSLFLMSLTSIIPKYPYNRYKERYRNWYIRPLRTYIERADLCVTRGRARGAGIIGAKGSKNSALSVPTGFCLGYFVK